MGINEELKSELNYKELLNSTIKFLSKTMQTSIVDLPKKPDIKNLVVKTIKSTLKMLNQIGLGLDQTAIEILNLDSKFSTFIKLCIFIKS